MAEEDDIRKVDRKHLARLMNWMDEEQSEQVQNKKKSSESEEDSSKSKSKDKAGETGSRGDSQ